MADRYYWSLSQMQALESATADVQQGLTDSLRQVNALIGAVEADPMWSGEHKVAFLAWMDLMKQYHSQLASDDVGVAVSEQLRQFNTALSSFYSDSWSMARLRSVL